MAARIFPKFPKFSGFPNFLVLQSGCFGNSRIYSDFLLVWLLGSGCFRVSSKFFGVFGIPELPGFAVGLLRDFSDLFGFLIGLAVRAMLFSGLLEVFWGFGIPELPGFAVGLFRDFSDLFGFLIGLAVRVRLFSGFLEVFWGFRDSQTFESSDFSP
ncbi:hypothetical protein [uncultured Rikenella sp.]|uniref:hypothetical protein n=1 Tax=uncultured Rikenella sp. TaxID=368003 RepID=UPI002627D134|nr:hypothetical protein [uncultured Rikenella sp.]